MAQQQEIPVYIHDPQARKDYTIDWGDYLKPQKLADDTDALVDSRWTVPDGITLSEQQFDDRYATIWITVTGSERLYDLTNHITTREGREDDQTIRLRIRDK